MSSSLDKGCTLQFVPDSEMFESSSEIIRSLVSSLSSGFNDVLLATLSSNVEDVLLAALQSGFEDVLVWSAALSIWFWRLMIGIHLGWLRIFPTL